MPSNVADAGTPDHVALIAITASSVNDDGPGNFQVVAIGTLEGEPEVWRYACHPLDKFKELLGKGRGIFTAEAALAGGTCIQDDIDDIGKTPYPPMGFSNVVMIAAYPYGIEKPKPQVRLDTIGFYEFEVPRDPLAPEPDLRVSRLCVVPVDPKDQKGVISEFLLTAQIGVAANGHRLRKKGEGDDFYRNESDRFDTRAFLVLKSEQGKKPRSLWSRAGATGAPVVGAGAWFDGMTQGLSLAPYNASEPRYMASPVAGPLSALAGKPAKIEPNTDLSQREVAGPSPLWASLGVPQMGSQTVTRKWGFRVGEGTVSAPTTLLFRFEMEADADVFRTAMQTLIEPWVSSYGDFTGSPLVQFAQEQRVGDIGLDLSPAATVTWLLTMRFDPKPNGYAGWANNLLTKHLESAASSVGAGLRQVLDAAPLSSLPSLDEPFGNNKVRWHMVGQLREYRAWRRLVRGPQATGSTAADPASWADMRVIEPLLTADFWNPKDFAPPLTGMASFKRLRAADGSAVKTTLSFTAPDRVSFDATDSACCRDAYQPAVSEVPDFADVDGGIRLSFELGEVEPAELEIGALRLSVGGTVPSDQKKEPKLLLLRRYWDPNPADPGMGFGADLVLQLPITGVRPAGQDASPAITARRPDPTSRQLDDSSRLPDPGEPLFLPIVKKKSEEPAAATDSSKGPDVTYTLAVRENVSRGRNHELRLALRTTSTEVAAAQGQIVVIDPEPFRVMAVEYVEPRAAANNEHNEVAVWNGLGETSGLSWRISDDAQAVRLVLPSQTIGEAMEKNRSDDGGRPPDIAPGAAAASRFGSLTLLEVDPTYADTDYREPGWNLRRILGYPGQRSPGARLRALRAELAYGLTTRFVPKSDVWITELAGTLGVPAEKLPATGGTKAKASHVTLANAVIGAERRRLAVEKLWAGRPDAQLKIEEGLNFGLRHHRKGKDGGPATPFRWPVPGEIEPDPQSSPAQQELIAETFSVSRDDTRAFAGGVPWAFESANILLEVYRQPTSELGRVQDLHLSALGAWAGQRAAFAKNKSIVDTETTMGRLQRYKLERIGRIGALWHRAKHVIVYERTVVPSRQFYNRDPIGLQQDEHAGRPVLRKVEEYVELLQRVRRYPENGTSVAAAGFLTGVEFKSWRIPVDSRWGGDIRHEGWAVPLWNTDFTPRPPLPGTKRPNPDDPSLVYPKPQIRAVMAGVGGGEISVEIDEPQKLMFYTSTLDGDSGDNTDAWRPVREVDFVDLPVPVAGNLKPRSDQLTDAILPAEPAHSPGYERLTVGLVPTKEAVALLNGRSAEGPGATLRNVTIARSAPVSTLPPGAPNLAPLTEYAANVRAELDGAVGRALGVLEKLDPRLNALGRKDIKAVQAQIEAAIKAGFKNFDVPRVDVPAITAAMPAASDKLKAQLRAKAEGEIARLSGSATALVETTGEGIRQPLTAVVGITSNILAVLQSLAMLDDDGTTQGYYALPEDERDEMLDTLQSLRARLWDVADDLKADIAEIGRNLTFDIGRLAREAGAGLDLVSDELLEAVDDVRAKIQKLSAEITAASDNWNQAVSDAASSAGAPLEKLSGQVKGLRTKINTGAGAAALRKLATALEYSTALIPTLEALANRTTNGPLGVLAVAVRLAERATNVAAAALNTLKGAAVGELGRLQDETNRLVSETTQMAQDKVTALTAILTDDKVMDALVEAEGALSEEVEDGDYAGWAKQAIDTITPLLNDFKTFASTLDSQVTAMEGELKDNIARLDGNARALIDRGIEALYATVADAIDKLLRDLVGGGLKDALQQAFGIADQAAALKDKLQKEITDIVGSAAVSAERAVEDIKAAAYAKAAEVTREIEARGRELVGSIQTSIADAIGTDPVALADEVKHVAQEGSNVLRLLRAVGDPPKTDRLGLNRPEVAYILTEANKVVDLTPAVALVNRVSDTIAAAEQAGKAVGDLLEGFGVRLPTGKLAEDLLPDSLRNLSVASLLPDMAGIDFRGLLSRAGFPDLDDMEAVKITQGFDKAERRQWLKAVIDVPFAQAVEVLSFGPVNLFVDDARFYSQSMLTAGLDGSTQSVKGRISGDWRIVCGGQDIITFRQTGLFFDDTGRLDFKIAPERVELADALEFLTNFLAASGKGDGLVIEPLMRGGVPAGVAATIDLALPDLTLGVFAISNLSLHILFGVAAIPEFELLGELSVAQRTAPFTLSVWILNGGGYVTQRLSFRPTARPKPILTYMLDVGIVAGVGIGFNFGVVSGGVWLQVGCSIAITWTTQGGGNTTTVTVFILARGNVDVAGLVTASIMLLLEVSYDGARMIGRGTLRLSFKISMFYTLRVNQSVQYVFMGKKKPQNDAYSDSYA